MQAQTKKNKIFIKITENHDTLIGKLSNQAVSLKNDMQDLQERSRTMEAQLGKMRVKLSYL